MLRNFTYWQASKSFKPCKLAVGALTLCTAFFMAAPVWAQTGYQWDGSAWDPALTAIDTDDTITVDSGDTADLGSGVVVNGAFTKLGEGALQITNAPASISGGFTVNGGLLEIINGITYDALSNNITVGETAVGALNIAGGATLKGQNIYAGYADGSTGKITVSGTGSSLTGDSNMYVGYEGHGTLAIDDGVVDIDTDIYAGYETGSTGEITVSGGTLVGDGIVIGDYGHGALTIETNSMVTITGDIYAGRNNDSIGIIAVSGGALTGGGNMNIGYSGNGTLTIKDGGAVTVTGGISTGSENSGAGEITVSGGTLTGGGDMTIGDEGHGKLAIENGGAVTVIGGISTGFENSGAGEITVSGTGSSLTGRYMYIGNKGDGTLTIENGGVANSSAAGIYAAYGAGSTGKITVSNGTLISSTVINIGNLGDGTLTIKDGGVVRASGSVFVGFESTGTGKITVSGTGSSLTGDDMYIGHSGQGAVTVGADGLLDIDGTIRVGSSSNTGLLQGTGDISAASVNVTHLGAMGVDKAGYAGTLTITGDINMVDDATLNVNMANDGSASKVTASGDITLGSANLDINLSSLKDTTSNQVILESTSSGTLTGFTGYTIKLNGVDIIANSRTSGSTVIITKVNETLELEVTGGGLTNEVLTWTGSTPGDWNYTTQNWEYDSPSISTNFFDGDAVVFDDVSGTVTIDDTVVAAKITVTGTLINLTLNGDLVVDGIASTLTDADVGNNMGTLYINADGGKLTLAGENYFAKGVIFNDGSLVLANEKALGTYTGGGDGVLNVVNGIRTLSIAGDYHLQNQFNISGQGLNVYLNGHEVTLGAGDSLPALAGNNKLYVDTHGGGQYGTLKLRGDNSAFAGSIDLYNGTLNIAHRDNLPGLNKLHLLSDATTGNNSVLVSAIEAYTADPTAANLAAMQDALTAVRGKELPVLEIEADTTFDGGGIAAQTMAVVSDKAGGLTLADGVTFTVANSVTGGHGGVLHVGDGGLLALSAGTNARYVLGGNKAVDGGAVYSDGGTDGGGTVIIASADFTGNTATSSGGAIYNSGTMAISDADFTGNEAGNNGGAVYNARTVYNAGTMAISDATFSNNTASNGGAVYSVGDTVIIASADFTGNKATGGFGSGGAIYNAGGTMAISNSLFSDNEATYVGGAVYSAGVSLVLTDTSFVDNISSYGAVDIDSGDVTINVSANQTSTYAGNTVGLYVYNAGQSSNIIDIVVDTSGLLQMADPMGSETYDSGSVVEITKSGAGRWALGGDSVFESVNGGANQISIDEGELYLYGGGESIPLPDTTNYTGVTAGNITLYGPDSSFTLAGGDLILGGTHSIIVDDNPDGIVLYGGIYTDSAPKNYALTLSSAHIDDWLLVDVATDATLTLNTTATITGGAGFGFDKMGAGKLVLAQSMDITGGVYVYGGTLELAEGKTIKADYLYMTGNAAISLTLGGALPAFTISGDADLGGTLNIAGIDSTDNLPLTIISAGTLNNSEFASVALGGTAIPTTGDINNFLAVAVEYTDTEVRVHNNGLVWFANDATAHGAFNVADEFTLGALIDLYNQPANTTLNWDGTSLTKTGAGTLIVEGSLSYTGVTDIKAGTLKLMNDAGLSDSSQTGIAAGAALDISGVNSGVTMNDLQGAGTITMGDVDLEVQSGNFSGVIAGGGDFYKYGTGTLTLGGVNTYTGDTYINDGTLALTGAGSIAASASIYVNGVLDISGVSSDGAAIKVLTGGGMVELGGKNLSVQSGDFSGDFSGANGGLTKVDSGDDTANTLVLWNDLNGAVSVVNVAGGTLESMVAQTLNTLNVDAGAAYDGGGNNLTLTGGTIAGTLDNVGWLNKTDTDKLTLAADSTISVLNLDGGTLNITGDATLTVAGASFVSGTTLGVSGGHSLAADAIDIDNGVTLDIIGSASQIIITASNAINGVFDAVTVGGSTVGAGLGSFYAGVDVEKTDSRTITVTLSDLAWNQSAPNSAHGVFNVGGNFTLNDDLADNTNSSAWYDDGTYGWDGKSLTKTGAGILTLGGNNTYTGATVIAEGVVNVTSADSVGGTSDIRVASGAAFILAYTADGELAKNISGAGEVSKSGDSTVTLTGTNTYTGGTTVAQGTLVAGNAGALGTGAVDLLTFGALGFDYSGAFANDITGDGTLNVTQSMTFTGDHSGHTGAVHVSGVEHNLGSGSFVSGAAHNIRSGATLSGVGTVGDLHLHSGSVLSPGNSLGTVDVNGDAHFYSGSTYTFEVAGIHDADPTASDLLAATGKVTINGGDLRHIGVGQSENDYDPIGTWTIISAVGGVTGTFDSITSDFVFLDADVIYNNNDVQVVLERNGVQMTDYALTRNQRAVSLGIESLGSGELYNKILALKTSSPIRDVYDQLSGELHASVGGALLNYDRAFGKALSGRATQRDFVKGEYPLWVTVDAFAAQTDGTGNTAKAKYSGAGISLGVEADLYESLMLGAAFRYSDNELKVNGRNSKADIESFSFALYGGWQIVDTADYALKATFGAAYGTHDVDASRRVTEPTMAQHLKADYDVDTWQTFAELALSFKLSQHVKLEPYAGVAWNYVTGDSFHEKGGYAALNGEIDSQGNVSTSLGVRGKYSVGAIGLKADISWLHVYGDRDPEASLGFAGGNDFSVYGAPLSRDALGLNLAVEYELTESMRLEGGYDAVIGDKYQSHGGHVTFSLSF